MKVHRTKSEQGSVLILALLSIVVFFVLATAFLMIAQQHLKMQAKEATRATAFYRAERGINAVINILMRDQDDDFRTAGEKKPPVFPDTVPYAFEFENVNFQVQRLDEFNNPVSKQITAQTGSPHEESMFETEKDAIWIKVTGFYYPRDEYDYNKITANDQKYMEQIIKRTIIVRLSKFPTDVFKYAFYTCGDVTPDGNVEISGPIWIGGTITSGGLTYDTSISTVASSPEEQDKCQVYLENIEAWGKSLCEDPDTVDIPTGNLTGGTFHGPQVLCCKEDLTILGNAEFLDTSGPIILIVMGNLKMAGTVTFQGLAMTFGDYIEDAQSSAGGSADNRGSIISLQDLKVHGGTGLNVTYKDYGDFGYGNTISTSKWKETWDRFYVERGGTTYTIEVEDVPVPVNPNPVTD